MNARLALGAGCCLVCAATGLLLTQPTTLPAQSGGGSQATLNSAVQRELDKLYTKNGKVPPQKGTKPASASRKSSPVVIRPKRTAGQTASSKTIIRKSQVVSQTSQPKTRITAAPPNRSAKTQGTASAKTPRPLFSKSTGIGKPLPASRPTSQQATSKPRRFRSRSAFTNSKRLTYSNTAGRSKKTAIRRNPRSSSATQPSAIKRSVSKSPTRIPTSSASKRPVIRQAAKSASGTRQPGNQSEVLSELQKMYERNGKQMPSLDARQLPNTTQGPRTVGQKPGPKVQPAAAPQTAAAPRLLDRLFPWARRAKKTPQPAKRISPAVRRAPNVLPANIARKPVQSRPIVRKKADTVPSLDGDIPARNNIKTAGKKPVAPTKAASQDDLPDLFPELSESEADGGSKSPARNPKSPFSGLKLTDDTPKSKDVRSNPSLDKPSKADEKKVAETKIDSERKEKLKKIADRSERKGLKGFCPVALRDDRELLDTVPDFRTVHGSKTFYFSSSDAKAKFDAAPQKYAPINNGNDIVLLNGEKKLVEGSLDHAVWYKDRLHLFSTPATLATFVQGIAKKRAVDESAKQADDDAEEDSGEDEVSTEEAKEAASAKMQDPSKDPSKDSSKDSFEKSLESKKK